MRGPPQDPAEWSSRGQKPIGTAHPGDWETRQARQRVKITVALFVPIAASDSNRDDVQDTLDYDKLREGIASLAASRHFNLQETLIDEVLSFCLELGAVRAATVRTEKPDVYPDCKTVGIESIRFAPL